MTAGRRPRRVRRRRVIAAAALGIVALGVAWGIVHKTMPAWYARLWYPLRYEDAIRVEARQNGLDPALVAGVIYRESKFSASSRSPRGAVGLMQVLPATARFIHSQSTGPRPMPARLGDPRVNIEYGTWYLRYLMSKYGSEPLALAAYNGGETNLREWLARAHARGRQLRLPDDIPFPETRAFVRSVGHARDIYRRAYGSQLGG